jgi:hypothetical protein
MTRYHATSEGNIAFTAEEEAAWDAEEAAYAAGQNDRLAKQARAKRDDLLAASDWTQLSDAPVNGTSWATYRQALRDITAQSGFPQTINWPDAP